MLILTIDQGTTGTTTMLVNRDGRIVDRAYREFKQHYPNPGWVEHDPLDIWRTVLDSVKAVCTHVSEPITAVGITNQRETTVVWDRKTGEPVYNAIVWQCRRTADRCHELRSEAATIRHKTGLPVDAYFSATKVEWILKHVSDRSPETLCFGTIDSWLIWQLTNGQVHATDYTNASRTLLYNIIDRQWDADLCRMFGIHPAMLPEVKPSAADYGHITSIPRLHGVPIAGVVGDQQAALFGQLCFRPGQVKNTYGTGCFVVMNTGDSTIFSDQGLITTLAVNAEGGPCYALEGSIFIAGAAVQWLRDELKLIQNAAESEAAAMSVDDTGGVYLVPAFVGLGAPHWDMDARGTLVGITRGTNRKHIIRATLEAIAYQTYDVVKLMETESATAIPALAVDGGATANNFLMQFQADILQTDIHRPAIIETTAMGAAYLAGLRTGVWKSTDELSAIHQIDKTFHPQMDADRQHQLLAGWQRALRQTMTR